jgi:hypothetical protein
MAAIDAGAPVGASDTVAGVPESTADPQVAQSVQAAHAAHASAKPPAVPAASVPPASTSSPAPKCGPPRPGSRRRGGARGRGGIAARRRAKKKTPVVGIVLGLFVLGVAGAGAWQVQKHLSQPGAGADVLSLLPDNTFAAASVERVHQLELDVNRLSGAIGRHQLEGSITTFQRSAVAYLMQGLGVSHDSATGIVKRTVAAAIGVVPEGEGAEQVVLIVIDPAVEPLPLLNPRPPVHQVVGDVQMLKKSLHVAVLGQVLALCKSPGPLARMMEAHENGGKGSLGAIPPFIEARDAYAKKGRAWFFISPSVPQEREQGLAEKSVRALPSMRYTAGWLDIRDPQAIVRGTVALADVAAYQKMRVKPDALTIADHVPADAALAVAVNLGDPVQTYDRLLVGLDARFERETGSKLSDIVRRFELANDLYLRDKLLRLIKGQIALCVNPSAGPGFAFIARVVNVEAATLAIKQALKSVLKGEYTPVASPGGRLWQSKKNPVVFGFVDEVLIIASGPKALNAVRSARSSGKTLAADAAFRVAVGQNPRGSLLLAVRESEHAQIARHGGGRALFVCLVSMEADTIEFSASAPNLAEALIWMGAELEGAAASPRPQPPTSPPAGATPPRAASTAPAQPTE